MRLTQVAGINPNGMAGAALTNLAKISKGPYNTASYANTQKYNSEKKFIFYGEMYDTLKGNELYGLLASQSAQAVLQKVEGRIRSSLKLRGNGYKEARFPRFHKKDTEWVLPYRSQQIAIKGNRITLPMSREYMEQTCLLYIIAQSIHNASWNRFIRMLSYNARSAGMKVIEVDARGTTQECGNCHHIKTGRERLRLEGRVHHCSVCGLIIGRDINASINILDRAALGQRGSHAQGESVRPQIGAVLAELRTDKANPLRGAVIA